MTEITKEQKAAAAKVHFAVLHEMNLAGIEGASVAAILAGAGTAIADVITAKGGSERVAPWFEAQAPMLRKLEQG